MDSWGPVDYTSPGTNTTQLEDPLPPVEHSGTAPMVQPVPAQYLGADAGAMSTHPQDLKAQDTHNMARGSGLEGRPVILDKLSQMDVGQGSAEEKTMSEAADGQGPGNPGTQHRP